MFRHTHMLCIHRPIPTVAFHAWNCHQHLHDFADLTVSLGNMYSDGPLPIISLF